ncbi:MAG: beta-lactamase family protein [Pyrinomonadaceae bacterium]|nr:beta-lactamase family protein [Pyrinomonadaceae bacterium]
MKLFPFAILLICFSTLISFAQTTEFIKDDGIINSLHQSNIGKITFMASSIPSENYREQDFLRNFLLKENTDFNLRIFLGKSLTNYLHQLAPEMNAEELNKNGNFNFNFYVDGSLIYQENLPTGAGSSENKKLRTVYRVPLITSNDEDHWGRFMWTRFMINGGEDALENGNHNLKIEIRPYLKVESIKTGEIIAQGQIELSVFKPIINESRVKIQPIKPNSGWKISKDKFNQSKIEELNRKIAENSFKEIKSIVVIKNGNLLIEEYFNGADRNTLHDTRSVGKTFASAMTGIAIRDGYLKSINQTLGEFYNLKDYQNYSPEKETVTIKNLLTMSSGFEGFDFDEKSIGNEENMYPQANWVKWTLNLPMAKRKVGEQWAYFTAGVVVLGDILQKKVPNGLEDYAAKKLFKPLEIKNYKWQYTPQKVANTAGGLQMSTLDFAKFGQLYKNGGKWKGKQIIPENWGKESLTKQFAVDERSNYGYLWWNGVYKVNGKDHEVYYGSGNGGNKIFVFKDLPLVIVITATAYNKPYMHKQIDKIMERYLLPAILEN